MSELKPCPFCGDTHVHYTRRENPGGFTGHVIACGGCETDGPWSASKEQATARWNARVSPWRSLKNDPLPNGVHVLIRGLRADVINEEVEFFHGDYGFGMALIIGAVSADGFRSAGFTEWMEVPA